MDQSVTIIIVHFLPNTNMYSYYIVCHCVSFLLSVGMIVLNSRDWQEIVRLPDFSHFINRLYPENPTGMHWYC